MNPCDRHDANILHYLNGELEDSMLEDFLAHLNKCSACREKLHEEQALTDLFRRSRPLYTAPDALRARVAAVAAGRASANGDPPLRQAASNWALRMAMPVAALILIALGLALAPAIFNRMSAAAFVDMAVTAHRSYSQNQLPLQIISDSPPVITAWFAGRVPFQFRLPVAESAPDSQPAYRLTGARMMRFKRDDVAFVSYQAKEEIITLLVAPEQSARALGGDEVRSGDLIFHYIPRPALSVITWSTHGLTYALVSSIRGTAQHSCLVCHQNMADKRNF
jgi:anti-sigma factor RsiW